MYKFFIKRILDFFTSLIIIILILPVFMVVTIVLFFQKREIPFFFQNRPGRDEEKIRIIKFKSMTDEKDEKGFLLPDNQRITKFGNFIRKTLRGNHE